MKKKKCMTHQISEFEAYKRLVIAIFYADRPIPYEDYCAFDNTSSEIEFIKLLKRLIKERGL